MLLASVLQVVSRCISQQVDLLEVLGQLTFSLPEPGDAAYEAKATAAVEALLKDMEVAQVRQAGSQPRGHAHRPQGLPTMRWCQQRDALSAPASRQNLPAAVVTLVVSAGPEPMFLQAAQHCQQWRLLVCGGWRRSERVQCCQTPCSMPWHYQWWLCNTRLYGVRVKTARHAERWRIIYMHVCT
jgi:hypothetical protein